jgi:hypothetical protein
MCGSALPHAHRQELVSAVAGQPLDHLKEPVSGRRVRCGRIGPHNRYRLIEFTKALHERVKVSPAAVRNQTFRSMKNAV